ncbi:MAG: substrate-binding domain-containing protein [Candidatus Omnitrophota bacterium]|nr:substrate-binding domain-containing protein [Candidatus Omnitrophota bacterium]
MDKLNKTPTFALIIPRFEDIFHSFYSGEVIKGVSLAASRLKVDILIHIPERFSHEDWLPSFLLNREFINGILFADIDGDATIIKTVVSQRMPYLVMNNYFQKEVINCIAVDNKKATLELVDYIVSLGHKKIATIAGDLTTQAGKLRLEGFKEGLQNHDLEIKDDYIEVGGFLRTPAREAAMKLLGLKDRPTAIFAASDVMALELMDVAKKSKINIPEDLSVIGFDDNPINIYSPVKLTTVSQPISEMGRLALENLNQISQGKARIPVKIMLETKLIKRDSCTTRKE